MNQQGHPSKLNKFTVLFSYLVGTTLTIFSLVLGAIFIVLDLRSDGHGNPYMGLAAYLILPGVFLAGAALLGVYYSLRRKNRRRYEEKDLSRFPIINLNTRRHFTIFVSITVITFVLAIIGTVTGYKGFHFTESVEFCGLVCHSVMEPEHTAFQHSPHANVTCVKCHIGPGAGFFVKSKLNGLYQVYSVMADKFSRPIPTPVHNLRPAKETCYTCHWPNKFFGAVEQSRVYFMPDEENSPWTIRLLVKVGGGDAAHGRAKGIHWHMAVANKVEYIATDERRQVIPWVRITDEEGNVRVYNSEDDGLDEEAVAKAFEEGEVRTMDCIDCHNRPSHQYQAPNRSMDEYLVAGLIDPTIPSIKRNAAEALTQEFETKEEGLAGIRSFLEDAYPEKDARIETAIEKIQEIYARNFFPEMKVDWLAYPDNIGHRFSPGCFRCHDNLHKTEDGNVLTRDCNTCHEIIAQGPGNDLEMPTTGHQEFKHPEDIDEEWKETLCSDCHEGTPVM